MGIARSIACESWLPAACLAPVNCARAFLTLLSRSPHIIHRLCSTSSAGVHCGGCSFTGASRVWSPSFCSGSIGDSADAQGRRAAPPLARPTIGWWAIFPCCNMCRRKLARLARPTSVFLSCALLLGALGNAMTAPLFPVICDCARSSEDTLRYTQFFLPLDRGYYNALANG